MRAQMEKSSSLRFAETVKNFFAFNIPGTVRYMQKKDETDEFTHFDSVHLATSHKKKSLYFTRHWNFNQRVTERDDIFGFVRFSIFFQFILEPKTVSVTARCPFTVSCDVLNRIASSGKLKTYYALFTLLFNFGMQ